MQQDIGFDIISDLNLKPSQSFNWENKPTSLYCIVAGNVSTDLRTIFQVLAHLSRLYQGVFYVPGILEYETSDNILTRTSELITICDGIPGVCLLHQQVIVIDGVAIVGVNGWSNIGNIGNITDMEKTMARFEDLKYLKIMIQKLQRHLDVKEIVVVTSAVPHDKLYYGEEPDVVYDQIPLTDMLSGDTEHKVKYWVFGTYTKTVDTELENIKYLNNPFLPKTPYWAKRLTVSV